MCEPLNVWIATQQSLLSLEHAEEEALLAAKLTSFSAKECQDAGISILQLEIDGISTSLFGRCTITVKTTGKSKELQNKSMKVGDEIQLLNPKFSGSTEADLAKVDGVISKVSKHTISFVCDEAPDESYFEAPLRLDLRSNDYTFRKMTTALTELSDNWTHPLVRAIFDTSFVLPPAERNSLRSIEEMRNASFNKSLNPSQLNAVFCALHTPSISLIHGPVLTIACLLNL